MSFDPEVALGNSAKKISDLPLNDQPSPHELPIPFTKLGTLSEIAAPPPPHRPGKGALVTPLGHAAPPPPPPPGKGTAQCGWVPPPPSQPRPKPGAPTMVSSKPPPPPAGSPDLRPTGRDIETIPPPPPPVEAFPISTSITPVDADLCRHVYDDCLGILPPPGFSEVGQACVNSGGLAECALTSPDTLSVAQGTGTPGMNLAPPPVKSPPSDFEKVQEGDRPFYLIEKEGYLYCRLCNQWADEGHLGSKRHSKRTADPEWYIWDDAETEMSGQPSAAQTALPATPDLDRSLAGSSECSWGKGTPVEQISTGPARACSYCKDPSVDWPVEKTTSRYCQKCWQWWLDKKIQAFPSSRDSVPSTGQIWQPPLDSHVPETMPRPQQWVAQDSYPTHLTRMQDSVLVAHGIMQGPNCLATSGPSAWSAYTPWDNMDSHDTAASGNSLTPGSAVVNDCLKYSTIACGAVVEEVSV